MQLALFQIPAALDGATQARRMALLAEIRDCAAGWLALNREIRAVRPDQWHADIIVSNLRTNRDYHRRDARIAVAELQRQP